MGDKKMEPALFIISRTDLASMNPGRAIAQGSHATSAFEDYMRAMSEGSPEKQDSALVAAYHRWKRSAGSFGVTYVYEGSIADLGAIENNWHEIDEDAMIADSLTDPEYFVRDGDVLWRQENVHTCTWMFGNKSTIQNFLRKLKIKMHR